MAATAKLVPGAEALVFGRETSWWQGLFRRVTRTRVFTVGFTLFVNLAAVLSTVFFAATGPRRFMQGRRPRDLTAGTQQTKGAMQARGRKPPRTAAERRRLRRGGKHGRRTPAAAAAGGGHDDSGGARERSGAWHPWVPQGQRGAAALRYQGRRSAPALPARLSPGQQPTRTPRRTDRM